MSTPVKINITGTSSQTHNLPPNWIEQRTEDGNVYYKNQVTNETSSTFPIHNEGSSSNLDVPDSTSPSTSPSSSSNILKLKEQSKVKLKTGTEKLSKYFSKKVKKIKNTTKDIVHKVENELSNAITNENDDDDTIYEVRVGIPGFRKSFYTARGRGFSTSEKLVKTSYVPPSDIIACVPSAQELQDTHQYDYHDIDEYVKSMPEVPAEIAVAELALQITHSAKNDLEKFRSLYQWIASNIAYDTEAFFNGKKSYSKAPDIIRHKKAVCQGFCNLFYEFTKCLGLTAAKIGGWASATRFQVKIDESIAHAWNAMKVDNRWYLLDSCWGAGYISSQGNFKRKFEEFYFASDPNQLIYTHFPESPEWQLLPEKPVTKEQWQTFVTVYPNFFQRGLQLVSHPNAVIHVNKTSLHETDCQVVITAPANIHLMHSLMVLKQEAEDNNNNGNHGNQSEWLKLDDSWSFYHRKDDQRNFLLNFPGPGSYSLEIFLKEKLPLQDSINMNMDDSYEISLKYQIEVTGEHTKSPKGPFPKTYSRFQKSNHHLLSPALPCELKSNSTIMLQVTQSTAIDMRVLNSWDNKMFKMELAENHYQKSVMVQKGSVFVLASYPNSPKGKYLHLLEFVI